MAPCPCLRHQSFPGQGQRAQDLADRAGWAGHRRAVLLACASYFAPDEAQALAVLGEAHAAVSSWRRVALCPEVGLRAVELDGFASAFEHEQMDAAAALLGR